MSLCKMKSFSGVFFFYFFRLNSAASHPASPTGVFQCTAWEDEWNETRHFLDYELAHHQKVFVSCCIIQRNKSPTVGIIRDERLCLGIFVSLRNRWMKRLNSCHICLSDIEVDASLCFGFLFLHILTPCCYSKYFMDANVIHLWCRLEFKQREFCFHIVLLLYTI